MTGCTKINASEYNTVAGEACTKTKCKEGELRLGTFFDGTGNDDKNPIEYSNVKKLFDVYKKNDYNEEGIKTTTHSVYVRGVGSRTDTHEPWKPNEKLAYSAAKKHETDGTTGGMWGAGGHARVADILFQLQQAIDEHEGNCGFQPEKILLDVFGFSRGAIQARHFVNVIKQGFYKLDGTYSDYEPSDFTIKTLNIFDSVSSFEGLTVLTPGTPQDPSWAYNVEGNKVERIIHFIADDEYRQNFDGQVTTGQDLDYPKDIEAPTLTELVFLGAHSDVGGGYRPVHHGRNNNDLAKIYLNKMYEMAKTNGVPFLSQPEGSSTWDVPDDLQKAFQKIQDKYNDYPKLKLAHKKFRERMGYLYDPGSNKHPSYQLAGELNKSIEANKKEINHLNTEIASLEEKLKKASGSQDEYLFGLVTVTKGDKSEYQGQITQAENRQRVLERINKDYNKKLLAYNELKKAFFGNEADYKAFIATSVDFHNTYVHKSHSSMWQIDRKDYDVDGNAITGRERDFAGMNAEVDGGIIFDGHLHRKWYLQKNIDVVKKICNREQKDQERIEFYNSGLVGTIADYANRPGQWVNEHIVESVFVPFDWAKPKKLSK